MASRMGRRGALRGLAVVALAPALPGCAVLPVFPPRPDPADTEAAAGWVGLAADGRVVLQAPRQEMGQGVLAALRRIVAAEMEVPPEAIEARLPDTGAMPPVRATVGSESLHLFAEPLARAAAALREELTRRASARLTVIPAQLLRTRDGFAAAGSGAVSLRDLAGGRPVTLGAAAVRDARPRGLPIPPVAGPAPELAAVLLGVPAFAADGAPPDLLHGAMLRPPRLGARLRRAVPGGAPAVPGFAAFAAGDGWAGLVAERPGALARALAAAEPAWEGGSEWGAAELARAVDVDARLAGRGRTSLPHRLLDGELRRAAPWDVDMRLDVPMAAHAAIEPRAALARWSADLRRLEVTAGTQDAFFVRATLARHLGLRESDIVVRSARMGGAFGGRSVPNVELEAARLARAVAPRPVLVQWTRADEFREAFHRPPSSHRVRARLGPDGRIAAWWHAFVSGHVIFSAAAMPGWLQGAANAVTGDTGISRGARPPYAIGEARVEFDAVRLPVPTGPWRGLGAAPNAFAIEGAMDALAMRAGADPVAFRLAHLGAEPRLAACLRRAADMAGWGRRTLPRGRALGVGCAPYKDASWAAVVAEVESDGRGSLAVTGLWCAQDSGRVLDPDRVRAQAEGNLVWALGSALKEELTLAGGAVAAATFADYRLPTLLDVPRTLDVALVDPPPGAGFGGAGETALGPALAAIANAASSATGERLVRLPLRPNGARRAGQRAA
ncbi:molybdopterin cofactor-binding domain-containing protein (plasmid) [Roseomonas sp. CCTCC AB2023176]|uniref:xanthine dehydrogenase family protein molybdopterin-binding subunit n=1 Tax=Roseomonas sp. CCTCC AB2023176 TaxID=3342640 RepID=UPI0035D737C7